MQLSRLTIVFKESHYTPIKRFQLHSNVELIALFGGLLALFFGASLLSFVELAYVFVWQRCDRRRLHCPVELNDK